MFRVLTAHGSDAQDWDRFIEALPYDLRDIHFTSAYGRVQEKDQDTAHLAVWVDEDRATAVIQPFLLRSIGRSGFKDMASVGYGGPVSTGPMPAPSDGLYFDDQFRDWRRKNRVVAEFYMLNPAYIGSQMVLLPDDGFGVWRRVERDVVILPTDTDADGLPFGMRDNRRQSVKKATTASVRGVSPSVFSDLYDEAMQRKGASPRWRFDEAHFLSIQDEIGSRAQFLGAFEQSELIAAALFYFSSDVAYYMLAATIENPPSGYSDRLILEALRIAHEAGCSWLHLGGGVTPAVDDSLLAYKRSFGGFLRPAYSVRRIYDRPAYDALTRSLAPDEASSFFPAYRAREAQAA